MQYYETLKRRSYLNSKGTLYKLEDWVIKQCKPYPGMRVLDLGCGTGKHTFPFADLVSPGGSILGIDISQEAVTEVNEKAKTNQLKQIRAMKGSSTNASICCMILNLISFYPAMLYIMPKT